MGYYNEGLRKNNETKKTIRITSFNFVVSLHRVMIDSLLQRQKPRSMVETFQLVVVELEQYFRQRLLNAAHGRSLGIRKTSARLSQWMIDNTKAQSQCVFNVPVSRSETCVVDIWTGDCSSCQQNTHCRHLQCAEAKVRPKQKTNILFVTQTHSHRPIFPKQLTK